MNLASVPFRPLDETSSLTLRLRIAAVRFCSGITDLVEVPTPAAASRAALSAFSFFTFSDLPSLSFLTFSLTTVTFFNQRERPLSSAYPSSSDSDEASESDEDAQSSDSSSESVSDFAESAPDPEEELDDDESCLKISDYLEKMKKISVSYYL